RPVERAEQVVEHGERLDRGQLRAQLAAHRVALEVPGDVLADVAAAALLALEELGEQLCVPAEGARDVAEARLRPSPWLPGPRRGGRRHEIAPQTTTPRG